MKLSHINLKFLFFLIAPAWILFSGCEKNDSVSAPPTIEYVRVVDSTLRDSTFTSSLTGMQIVIHGSNFAGLQQVYFNDFPASFNPVFVTNTDIIVDIPANAPTEATNPDVSNQIRVVTTTGEAMFEFMLVPPPPVIRSISNEMAFPGEVITIRGAVFYGIEKIIFPGNIEAADFTVVDTATIRVTVPANLTETGTIQVVGRYGTGENPFILFNDQEQAGMLANFEWGSPKFGWAWWGGIHTGDGSLFPGNRGNYVQIKPGGTVNANDLAWYQDNRVVNVAEQRWLPESAMNDPIGNYAMRFEIFVKNPWKTGTLLIRNEGSWKYTARYAPWLNTATGDFKTDGWVTVTIPLTEFRTKANDIDGSGSSAQNLSELLGTGSREVGIMLMNDSNSPLTNFDAAFDNIRIVRIQ